jgi:uncharacterized protein
MVELEFEWDQSKEQENLRKHGVLFSDAAMALSDPGCRTVSDPDASGEQRLISVGADLGGRVLVTVFTPRGSMIRIISSRKASPAERRWYEGES